MEVLYATQIQFYIQRRMRDYYFKLRRERCNQIQEEASRMDLFVSHKGRGRMDHNIGWCHMDPECPRSKERDLQEDEAGHEEVEESAKGEEVQ